MEDLKIANELLKSEIIQLTHKNKVYQEVVEYYANPLNKYDQGVIARKAFKNLTIKNYKYNRINDLMFNPIATYSGSDDYE
jgi:hypothetical protein